MVAGFLPGTFTLVTLALPPHIFANRVTGTTLVFDFAKTVRSCSKSADTIPEGSGSTACPKSPLPFFVPRITFLISVRVKPRGICVQPTGAVNVGAADGD